MVYTSVAAMCIGVVPFMMFYYEAEDPDSRNWQLWTAIKYELTHSLSPPPSSALAHTAHLPSVPR